MTGLWVLALARTSTQTIAHQTVTGAHSEMLFTERERLDSGMAPLDTAAAAADMQTEIHRRMGPEARVRLALEMSELVRQCARAGIAARNPSYSARQVTEALIHQLYGITVSQR